MDDSLLQLFHELADLDAADRERIFAERRVPAEVRAEVESLLGYDSQPDDFLARRVAGAAAAVLCAADAPGECGPYRLKRLLGSGGMGAVYLAERGDGEIEQQVAVKLLRSDADRPAWRDRFLRERQFLANLNHPAIARLLDAGHTGDGRPYLVMEYVDGAAIDVYAQNLDLPAKLKLFAVVCDAVSHAHRQLIVHRDLKPSNILVDSSGRPKLLDFGIAKLLDVSPDETQTVERVLTPSYASPEQIRGDMQTTSTDIYSLGAVLHKLLLGRPPREQAEPGDGQVRIPRDAEHILRKALEAEPADRYASVDALAEDIRAFLELRPVKARSADSLYRVWKFVRRHRQAVAATAVTLSALVAGVAIANQQRSVAKDRLEQMRQLTNRVLLFDRVISGQQSSAKAREDIVTASKKNLEMLEAEARVDSNLALEVGEAYSHLARVQGISIDATSSGFNRAEESLAKAYRLVAPVLKREPGSRRALWVSARIAHDRALLAASRQRAAEASTLTGTAVTYLDRFVALGALSEAESDTVSELYYNIAITEKNLYQTVEAIRDARRSAEISRTAAGGRLRAGLALSMVADLERLSGDPEAALRSVREAKAELEQAHFPSEAARRSAWFTVLLREGRILGTVSGLSLNRPAEAEVVLQKAFQMLEDWTRNEPEDTWRRLLYASIGRIQGEVAGVRDAHASLAAYDRSLARLGEVHDNLEARRGEAELLAGSAAALMRLHRTGEAKKRIEQAFELLRQTGDYPAERFAPDDAIYAVLRAQAGYDAAMGRRDEAAVAFRALVEKIEASKPGPVSDLRHAFALSDVYAALAALGYDEFRARRLELWRQWDQKLPGNAVVRRQMESAAGLLRRRES